jgi:hypothetical protein
VTFDVTDLVEYVPCRSDPCRSNSDSVAAVPRSFDFSIESPVSVEQIHSAFSEKDYWLARLAAVGGIGGLDSFASTPDLVANQHGIPPITRSPVPDRRSLIRSVLAAGDVELGVDVRPTAKQKGR